MACNGDPIECGYEAALGEAEERIRQLEERIRQLEEPERPPQGFFRQLLAAIARTTPAYGNNYYGDRQRIIINKRIK